MLGPPVRHWRGLCFALAGHQGAALALALGAGFAAPGSPMDFLRLTVNRK